MNHLFAQKVKEIVLSYIDSIEGRNRATIPSIDLWLATPQAAAILSGEDWKEDGNEPINIDFNTRVVVTDNKGKTRKYKLIEVDH